MIHNHCSPSSLTSPFYVLHSTLLALSHPNLNIGVIVVMLIYILVVHIIPMYSVQLL